MRKSDCMHNDINEYVYKMTRITSLFLQFIVAEKYVFVFSFFDKN